MWKVITIGILSFQALVATLSAVESQTAVESQSEKNVLSTRLQNFSEAANKGDSESMTSFFTKDAELTRHSSGEVVTGAQIKELMQKIAHDIKDRQLKFSLKTKKIEFPDENDAIVETVVEVRDKNGGLLHRAARRIDLVKDNGQWYFDAINDIEVPPAPHLFAHLKELDWLVGNWKDSDDNVDITLNNRWDKFKNFLIQHFKMEVLGLDALEGTQIIGWDPIEKKIHSWLFDSDGGTGTGFWTKNGNSWEVTMTYTFSDGSKGSAKNIYTKVNDDSYTFASTNRKINNQAQPDVEPVTVVKEK